MEDKNFKVGEVAKHFDCRKLISTEIELCEFGELLVIEHVIKIFEFTAFELKFYDILSRVTPEVFFEDFFCKSAGKVFPSLDVFRTFDWDTIEDFEFFEQIKDVESVALFFGDWVAREVKNDKFVQATEVLDLFGVRDLIVSDVKFHEGSEFGEVFESVDDVIFQRKLEKIM